MTARSTGGRKRLSGKRIPESGSQIGERGTARSAIEQVAAAQGVEGQVSGLGQRESNSRTGFDEIGPVLVFGVHRQVAVPVKLRPAELIAQARLRVGQNIVIEAADVEGVDG